MSGNHIVGYVVSGVVVAFIIFVATVLYAREPGFFEPDFSIEEAPEDYSLLEGDIEERQGKNECGPYAAAAAIEILGGDDVDYKEVVSKTKWRPYKGLTLPNGVEGVVKDYGLNAERFTLNWRSDERTKDFLVWVVSQDWPTVILGKKGNIQHYVTVVGYKDRGASFTVYDPLEGVVEWTGDEILQFWHGGGMWGAYKYDAVVVSK